MPLLDMFNLLIIWKGVMVLFQNSDFGPSDQSLADFPFFIFVIIL